MNEFGNTSSTYCGLSPVKWSEESQRAATRQVQNPPMTTAPITGARQGGPMRPVRLCSGPILFHSQPTIQHPTQISKEGYATAIHSSHSACVGVQPPRWPPSLLKAPSPPRSRRPTAPSAWIAADLDQHVSGDRVGLSQAVALSVYCLKELTSEEA
jgi:hypothetical protein